MALRLTIGWHFFYEGVWKITNSDKFSAAPFLTNAKGPAAPLFYAMIPDINGEKRLALTPTEKEVALLLLKGLGHREAADVMNRSERTVRQHAVAVYKKSGLSGRAELSAFFLEDLLLPQTTPPDPRAEQQRQA